MDTEKKSMAKNPAETSNFLSLLFFGWTIPIFLKGAKRDLKIDDLYDPVTSDESKRLGDHLEREWNKELEKSAKGSQLDKNGGKKSSRKPSLLLAITRMFWATFMVQGILLLVQAAVLRVMQPVLQGLIISYFDPGKNTITKEQALLYAGLLVLATLGIILIAHYTNLRTRQVGMCVRVACCSMIYRKVLRLNQSSLHNAAAGQVANLISNDVARFDEVPRYIHHVWILPIQVSLIGYLMWQAVGVVAFVGIGAMIMLTLPIQGYMSSLARKLRSKIAVRTDERIQLMSELISGIQVVKMYAWEKPFESLVSRVRKMEMKFISRISYIRALNSGGIIFSAQISQYFTLISFALMGNSLTAEVAFLLQGLFAALHQTCTIYFPQAIVLAGEAAVSLKRITDFLLIDEFGHSERSRQDFDKSEKVHRVSIDLDKVTANWIPDQLPATLSNVSMNVKSGSLCALVGPVGSGKSSLLHLVLGELPVKTGTLSLFTDGTCATKTTSQDIRISYVSQNPWLFFGSIRENILFGQPYNEQRYKEVTRVCALDKDFEQLPQGDLNYVGERGAALSGGQKARVNLARAVYRDADLYLLDDPLSAVDPRVGRHLFDECITRFLKDKTRILVTHQHQYLPQTDQIVLINGGVLEHQGTYDELVAANLSISDFGERVEIEKTRCAKTTERCESGTGTAEEDKNPPAEVTESMETLKDIGEEETPTGNMSSDVYWRYFKSGGNFCSLGLLVLIFAAGQAASSGTDYWVSFWTNQEMIGDSLRLNDSAFREIHSDYHDTEDRHRGVNSTAGSIWFDEHGLLERNLQIYGYTACIICCVVLTILNCLLFARMCINASHNIHNFMFGNLLKSRMRFFNSNPSGRILNRFSKDMGTMDELVPNILLQTLQISANMIGIFTLVVFTNVWMIMPVVVVCGSFYVLRVFYLKTAQDVQRLEGNAKSPMFSHADATLDGLTTIRSRGAGAEELLQKQFDDHQDRHTSAWYTTIAISCAFGFAIDLISCCFIACVCFSFIIVDAGNTLGGYVGLAISKSIVLCGMVPYGARQSTDLVTQMTSVERILQYTKLPTEEPFRSENPPPPTWPAQGGLIMRDVAMKYASNQPLVLKNVSVSISPGWKVGVVGRTGAGKSSLISALFRLAGEGLEGEIVLDGVETGSIGLHELRPYISIIPQEPILFSATLRYNLDPFHEYDDHRLWDALREVELGHVLTSLDATVAAAGANFSVGQRQLICLARAILRNNRILVLDEATANIDQRTDALIQKTIRRRFANCTVLTIAHRLNTIMDSDRVLVMAGGKIVEFGHPHVLLKNRSGHFSQMLQQTGNSMAEILAEIARDAYLLNPEFVEHKMERLTSSFTEENTRL